MIPVLPRYINLAAKASLRPEFDHWRICRLHEARAILANVPPHTDSLVMLATRVVAGQTDSASECVDAFDLLRQLDRHPLYVLTTAASQTGGAA